MLADVNAGIRRDLLRILNQTAAMNGEDVRRGLESRDFSLVSKPRVYNGLDWLAERGWCVLMRVLVRMLGTSIGFRIVRLRRWRAIGGFIHEYEHKRE